MAQTIASWFICDGRYRVDAIDAVGRQRARIIEIEDVGSGERFHGSARRLYGLFQTLGSSAHKAVDSCPPKLTSRSLSRFGT
jgi:hypothetical protein